MSVGDFCTTPYREGKKRVFDDLEYYPCCGFVRVHDTRDGSIHDINPVDFLERAVAIGKEITREPNHREKYRLATVANEVEEACKEAADMGNPLDPKVQAFYKLHKLCKRSYVTAPSNTPGVSRRSSGLLEAGG